MLIGDQAHTFPYIDVRNNTAKTEHEATTSKIGENQMFYLQARGRARRRLAHRQRLLQRSAQRITHGIRRRSQQTRRQPRRLRRLSPARKLATKPNINTASIPRALSKNHETTMSTPSSKSRTCTAASKKTEILRGVNPCQRRRSHSIMGPNGSQVNLSSVIAGHDAYEVTEGEVLFKGEDILEMDPEERAQAGVFLAFQYPVEIPGVSNTQFLKAAINAKRKGQGEEEIDAMAFVKLARQKAAEVNVPIEFLKRSINEGFSGGEKKRFEIFQMAMLDPEFCILDETDSGLDIDALQIVSDGVNKMRNENRGCLVITHYQRLLDHIVPGLRARLRQRPSRQVRRQGTGTRAGRTRLRDLLETARH